MPVFRRLVLNFAPPKKENESSKVFVTVHTKTDPFEARTRTRSNAFACVSQKTQANEARCQDERVRTQARTKVRFFRTHVRFFRTQVCSFRTRTVRSFRTQVRFFRTQVRSFRTQVRSFRTQFRFLKNAIRLLIPDNVVYY